MINKTTLKKLYKDEVYSSKELQNFEVPNFGEQNINSDFNYYGNEICSLDNQQIDTNLPQRGEIVYSESGDEYMLEDVIADGGEGVVYRTDVSNLLIKIYYDSYPILSTLKKEKIVYMANHQINDDSFAWPIEAVYNKDNEFVGYLMSYKKGVTLESIITTQIKYKGTLNIDFGIYNLTRKDLIIMVISILEKIAYLHKRNIIIGDFKLDNIIVNKKDVSEVYFIDCDSYQIDKFVATGFSKQFLAPEFNGKDLYKYYRTFESDNYAIFVLLFMLLHKGIHPYYQIQKEDFFDEIDKVEYGLFPYFLNEEQTKLHAPKFGNAKTNWGHLPGYIKKAFYHVGNINGKYFLKDKRLNVSQWLYVFREYLTDLEDGTLAKVDKDYNIGFFEKEIDVDYSKLDINHRKTSEVKSMSDTAEQYTIVETMPLPSGADQNDHLSAYIYETPYGKRLYYGETRYKKMCGYGVRRFDDDTNRICIGRFDNNLFKDGYFKYGNSGYITREGNPFVVKIEDNGSWMIYNKEDKSGNDILFPIDTLAIKYSSIDQSLAYCKYDEEGLLIDIKVINIGLMLMKDVKGLLSFNNICPNKYDKDIIMGNFNFVEKDGMMLQLDEEEMHGLNYTKWANALSFEEYNHGALVHEFDRFTDEMEDEMTFTVHDKDTTKQIIFKKEGCCLFDNVLYNNNERRKEIAMLEGDGYVIQIYIPFMDGEIELNVNENFDILIDQGTEYLNFDTYKVIRNITCDL